MSTPDGPRETDLCPTCGSTVGVHTTDEGTSHYVPSVHWLTVMRLQAVEAAARNFVAKSEREFGPIDKRLKDRPDDFDRAEAELRATLGELLAATDLLEDA